MVTVLRFILKSVAILLLMAMFVASAAWGTLFGEWKNSGTTAKAAMTLGVFCLIVAIVILGKAGS